MINSIESIFKDLTGLPRSTNLSVYPLTEHVGFDVRHSEKKENGEVFTPLELVDKMIEISKPDPTKFNMDLCAGRGQFTIRMLRKFVNENPSFDISYYLKNLHWFNEFNMTSATEIIEIFGPDINLAIGPAQELKKYPSENSIWLKGIFVWHQEIKKWVSFHDIDIDDFKSVSTNKNLNKMHKKVEIEECKVKPLF